MRKREKWNEFFHKWGYMIVWAMAACFGLLIILSYCYPKLAYDITRQHVVLEEEEEKTGIELTEDTVITYYLDVHGKMICGIQPCFDWGSECYPEGNILIEAWHEEGFPGEESYIGGTQVKLDDRLREAYVYAEIPNNGELSGALVFTVRYLPTGTEAQLPQIIMGSKTADNSKTLVNGETVNGDLLMYYASVKKTYPLVFDAKMMFLLLSATALFMTGRKMQEENQKQEENRRLEDTRETITKELRWHSKAVRVAVAIVTVLFLSVLTELLICNGRVLREGAYSETVQTAEDTAELSLGETRYIKTLTLKGAFEEDTEFCVEVYDQNGILVMSQNETVDARLDRSVCNIRENGSNIVIRCLTQECGEWSVTASDFVEWNGIRFLFWLSAFGLCAYFVIGHGSFTRRPEIVFAVICLLTGGMLILITGTNQISYDEQTHIAQVWNLSYISKVYDTDAVLACKTLTVPVFDNLWERRDVAAYLESIHDYETAGIFYTSKMISYNQRSYLPMAVFMAIGRSLRLPFAGMLSLSKFGNLLLYTVVCAIAIRVAKKGKALIAVIALMPNSIFLASQFSYDAFVNCFLLLAMVLVMNELLEPERKITPGHMLAMLSCFIMGSYSKQIYIIMALLLLFLGYRKFPSKKRAVIFKVLLVILCGAMLYEVVSPSYSGASAAETVANAGDKRVEGTGMLAQIQYILSQPFTYLKLLLSSMFIRIYEWFSGENAFHMYGYMGTPGTIFTWLWFAVWGMAALISPREEKRGGIGTRFRIVTILMVTGMTAVIWTVLYLSFNVVGSQSIEGVQNRYFAPLFLPVGMCLMNGRIHWKWKEESYYKLLFGAATLILFCCSYLVGIRQWYL